MKKTLILIFASVLLLFSLTACEFDESTRHLSGGELLDNDAMSEIKNELLSQLIEESASLEFEHPDEPAENESNLSGDDPEETPFETEVQTDPGEVIVYWTESGTKWHWYEDCSSLSQSMEILQGTRAEAEADDKTVCARCNKKHEKGK